MERHDEYHGIGGLVHVGRDWAFDLGELWESIDEIETSGIPLDDIGLALSTNWPATVTALALRRIGCLRAIIAEAKQPWT